MKSVQVFDPAMCCSTGLCGPVVDPVLPHFAADLAWLSGQGIAVKRHNLAQEPQAFVGNELVKRALTEHSATCLPLILVDGRIASQGKYPSRGELAAFVGLDAPEPSTTYLKGQVKDAPEPSACCTPSTRGGAGSKCCG